MALKQAQGAVGAEKPEAADVATLEALLTGAEVSEQDSADVGTPATDSPSPDALMGDAFGAVLGSLDSEAEESPEAALAEATDEPASEQELSEDQTDIDLSDDEAGVPKKGSRAQERIRGLVAEKKALQEKLDAQQAELNARLMQQQQAMQMKLQSMQQQQQAFMQQQQLAQQQAAAQREQLEEANLTPLQQYEKKLRRDLEAQQRQVVQQALTPLQRQLAQEKQYREQQQLEMRRQERFQRFSQEAAKARDEQILKGFDPKAVAELGESTDQLVLTWAAAKGIPPEAAGKEFKAFLDKYHAAKLGARIAPKGTPAKKTLPQPASAHGAPKQAAGGLPKVDKAILTANGYDNYFQWVKKGMKPFSKKPKG